VEGRGGMRGVRVVLLALTVIGLVPGGALADTGPAGGGYVDNTGTPVAEAANSTSSTTGGKSAEPPPCEYKAVDMTGQTVYDLDGTPIVHTEPGNWYVKRCFGPNGIEFDNELVWIPSDPAALAQQARESLRLPLPDVHTSPDSSGDQLVGVATWLWVSGAWSTQSATAAVPGVSVTVTATPVSVVWAMGDGGQVVRNGPGRPYDATKPSDEQSTDCSYTYKRSSAGQPGGVYPVTATITWSVAWSASGVAGGGALGAVTRSTAMSLRVAEAQALNR